jgi:hypothetical protein
MQLSRSFPRDGLAETVMLGVFQDRHGSNSEDDYEYRHNNAWIFARLISARLGNSGVTGGASP